MGREMMIPMVPIKLDKERHLLLDLRAAATFEFNTGKAIFYPPAVEKLSGNETIILLWACLRHEDERLSLSDVVGIVGRSRIKGSKIGKKLFEAWSLCVRELGGKIKQEVKNNGD